MDLPRHWRLKQQRYHLEGTRCTSCRSLFFPPREVCPECDSDSMEAYRFSGKGEVYSHSTVGQAPEGYEIYVPYVVALVRLEEGPLVTAQLTDVDSDEVHIGLPVEMVTRKLLVQGDDGLIIYGYKFRPAVRA